MDKLVRFSQYNDSDKRLSVSLLEASLFKDINMVDEKEIIIKDVEALENLIEYINEKILTGTVTLESVNYVKEHSSVVLGSLGIENYNLSIESYNGDNVAYMVASLESLSSALWNIWQNIAVKWRRVWDGIGDEFRDDEEFVKRYHEKIQHYLDKIDNTNKEIKTMDMSGLWYALGADNGNKLSEKPNIHQELTNSIYFNSTYPKIAIDNFNRFVSIVVSGDFSSKEAMEKSVINKLKSFRHSAVIFNQEMITGKYDLMGMYGLSVRYRRHSSVSELNHLLVYDYVELKRSKISMSKETIEFYTKPLTRIIKADSVTKEFISTVYNAGKETGHELGKKLVSLFNSSMSVKSSDVVEMANDAKAYGNLILQHKELIDAGNQASVDLKKLSDFLSKTDVHSDCIQTVTEIRQIADSLISCLLHPAIDNRSRMRMVMKGMFYFVAYATKRL